MAEQNVFNVATTQSIGWKTEVKMEDKKTPENYQHFLEHY
jgi:hypothetical protein